MRWFEKEELYYKEREERWLNSLGWYGRLVDEHWTFILILLLQSGLCFLLGFFIGMHL